MNTELKFTQEQKIEFLRKSGFVVEKVSMTKEYRTHNDETNDVEVIVTIAYQDYKPENTVYDSVFQYQYGLNEVFEKFMKHKLLQL